MSTTRQSIFVVAFGQSPDRYTSNPGEIPGPWSEDVAAALKEIAKDVDVTGTYWLRGGELWVEAVETDDAARDREEQEEAAEEYAQQ